MNEIVRPHTSQLSSPFYGYSSFHIPANEPIPATGFKLHLCSYMSFTKLDTLAVHGEATNAYALQLIYTRTHFVTDIKHRIYIFLQQRISLV
jgi:hypothetical protein